jgi:hypothetical protein
MDTQAKNKINSKSIFRISISFVVSTIASQIVFIIFWSFAFFPVISDSAYLGGLIFSIGAVAALFAGILCFRRLNKYLKDEMQNI